MKDETLLIKGCLEGNAKMQRRLYNTYAPKMYGICLRYAQNQDEASDILQEGFIKVFTKLQDFRNEGSLEGWIKKIMINTAINFYIKEKRYLTTNLETGEGISEQVQISYDNLQLKDLLKLVQGLPAGYRAIFNLYEIEGYTHKEISEILGISINTSKTQLMHARRFLQKQILSIEKQTNSIKR
ncbi:MAG TPA: RNA polymerase sigma factor [Bacteroidales bacterium]|nr:RNA polymerase sigma factor [Bacteroidales bacterium]HQQ01939.1 RNA polymerase sigma factor [Bacteroidales bacterium]